MVLIAVVGGTGLAGRAVVHHTVSAGHQVRSLSRHLPAMEQQIGGAEYVQADLRAGTGVTTAFAGVEVLIDTLNASSGASLRALPVTSGAVLNAAAQAEVRRCVLLTIVNAGECAMGYYQAQAARARSYEKSKLTTTVVAATQFHNLVAGIFAGGAKIGVIPAFMGVSVQPISTADVAAVLVAEALRGGRESEYVLAGGPAVHSMQELALMWKQATGSKALISPMPLPGSFDAFLRAGKN
ncbi:NAD(P)H-binding protein [Specibacter sp. NPDC078709]|uniref:SDR family oxidoreductase n=1 Tax=Specibacter sp. NPDC078709 TaxID=3154364 RepID=UPI0034149818